MTIGEETLHLLGRKAVGQDENDERNQPLETEAKEDSEVRHREGQGDDRNRAKD